MKNTIKAITLAMVLTFGATFANAGLLVSDRSISTGTTCSDTTREGVIVAGRDGLLVSDRNAAIFTGIKSLLQSLTGVIVAGRDTRTEPCNTNGRKGGLLVSD